MLWSIYLCTHCVFSKSSLEENELSSKHYKLFPKENWKPESHTHIVGILIQGQMSLKTQLGLSIRAIQMCICTWDSTRKLTMKEKVRFNEPKPIKMFLVIGGERELLNLYGVRHVDLSPNPQRTRAYAKQASKNERDNFSEISIIAPSPSVPWHCAMRASKHLRPCIWHYLGPNRRPVES